MRALFVWEAPPRRDALLACTPPPFASQPDIPVEGSAEGLAWGHCEADERASAWRVLMTVEMPRVGDGPLAVPDAPFAIFRRYRFRGRPLGDAVEVFAREGLDVERVAMVLPEILQ